MLLKYCARERNLMATLCQTRSAIFFTFYKNKNVKKIGDRV